MKIRSDKALSNLLAHGFLALALALVGAPAGAQERFLVEGIFDAELHDTDSESRLLTKNDGDLSYLGRVQAWSAFQASPGVQVYALVEGEVDNFGGQRASEAELEQYTVRYTSHTSPFFFVEAGRILGPLTVYSDRHLSTKNPLIGQAYTFLTTYPLGIQVAGTIGKFDYRAALVDEPDIKPDFISVEPGSAFRPVLGLGITPVPQLRLGLSYTTGPYLGSQANPGLPQGNSWRDFDQHVFGLDFQFSRGYLELNGQFVWSRYEIPFLDQETSDQSGYLELKYTWTPRLYGAVRYGRNQETAIEYPGGSAWSSVGVEFSDLEVGLGYRFTPDTQLKVAFRNIYLEEGQGLAELSESGHSLSLQFSHHFDVRSWWDR